MNIPSGKYIDKLFPQKDTSCCIKSYMMCADGRIVVTTEDGKTYIVDKLKNYEFKSRVTINSR